MYCKQLFCTSYLVIKVYINIFTEGISFRQACGTVLHQVEGLQGPKGRQQLLHLRQRKQMSHLEFSNFH